MSHSGVWNHCGEDETSLSGTGKEHHALLILHMETLWVEAITEARLKFLFLMYISPEETFNFEVCSQGKTELSAGAPPINKKIYIWKGLLGVCLHLTFKPDDGKYPDDQQEVKSSHFISAAH